MFQGKGRVGGRKEVIVEPNEYSAQNLPTHLVPANDEPLYKYLGGRGLDPNNCH